MAHFRNKPNLNEGPNFSGKVFVVSEKMLCLNFEVLDGRRTCKHYYWIKSHRNLVIILKPKFDLVFTLILTILMGND